jgi:hypothetical protein
MIRIRISDDAVADLVEGFGFYENQEAGLGEYFASTLNTSLLKIHHEHTTRSPTPPGRICPSEAPVAYPRQKVTVAS